LSQKFSGLKLNRRGPAFLMAVLLALVLATNAGALFGKKQAAVTTASAGAPTARELQVKTYRNIPYHAQFLASDSEGNDMTYAVAAQPKHGTVTVEGTNFVYTPAENRTGSDSFTYVAKDSEGNVSTPATVSVTINKAKSGVCYVDMTGNSAAAAAQSLAEEGVFVGAKIGDQYYFEPDRTVSRGQFLAMVMETAGLDASSVTMTGFCDDSAIPTWAKAYAAAGLSEGVVQGVSTADGVAFRAEDAVTFNEAAAILNRVLSVNDVDLTTWYADRTAVPSWAAQAVGNMESVNVLATGSFGSDHMSDKVTRADAAEMLSAAKTLLNGEDTGFFSWIS